MPRAMSNAYLGAIACGLLRPAFFVEAHFVSGPIYVWSGLGQIVWNGQTWTGVGSLGKISTIEEGSTVEAKGTSLSLSGIDPVLLADVLLEFQVGLPAIIWLGLFDASLVLIPDPVCCFAGTMDQPTIDVSGDAATITVNCENRLYEMNVPANRRYTQEDQQRDYPGDLGFQFVNSIQESQIFWGTGPGTSNNL